MLLVLFKKFLGKGQSHKDPQQFPSETPEQQVIRIQQGDLRLHNQFIIDYQPFVAKVTSRFCRRYIDPSRDDEYSIALAAFHEAVNQFSQGQGRSFLSFAETVIRRRLIDYIRKEQRFTQQIPYSSFDLEDDEDNVINPVEIQHAVEQHEKEKTVAERKNEIREFTLKLKEYGISFQDLVENSPKHSDSRQSFFVIGRLLAEEPALISILTTKKTLPIKELLDKVGVSRKTLERNRKYIIAIAMIYHGQFPFLKDYLHIGETTERTDGHE